MDSKKHNATVFLNFIPGERVEWWLLTGEIFQLLKSHCNCLHWVCVILGHEHKYLIVPGRKLSIRNCFHRKLCSRSLTVDVASLWLWCLLCWLWGPKCVTEELQLNGWLETFLHLRQQHNCVYTDCHQHLPFIRIVRLSSLGGVPHRDIQRDFSRNWIVANYQ